MSSSACLRLPVALGAALAAPLPVPAPWPLATTVPRFISTGALVPAVCAAAGRAPATQSAVEANRVLRVIKREENIPVEPLSWLAGALQNHVRLLCDEAVKAGAVIKRSIRAGAHGGFWEG